VVDRYSAEGVEARLQEVVARVLPTAVSTTSDLSAGG
jgi:hypothetical protein